MSLAKKAVSGAAWTITTGMGARVLGLVGTLLLVRYLTPAEYGEVSAASIVVLTASQLSTLGVGPYIIANPKAGREVVFHAALLHVVLALLALGIVVLLRAPLGSPLEAPAMGRFVPGLALSILIDRVSFMPERLATRSMRFRAISLARGAGELAFTGVSLTAAMAGLGGMSVVLGNLARSAVRSAWYVSLVPPQEWLRPARLRWSIFRDLLHHGVLISVSALASFASRRWDNLLVSRFFGPAALGIYNLAYNLAEVPVVQVGEQITDVLMISFANAEREKHAQALLRATGLLALLMCPIGVGFGLVAPGLIDVFFKKSWAGVGVLLALLAALSVWRPIGGAMGAYLLARGHTAPIMRIEWVSVGLMMLLISTIGRISLAWVCLAVGIAFGTRVLIYLYAIKRLDEISIRVFLARLLPPLCACAPMAGAVLLLRHLFAAHHLDLPLLRVALEISIGVLTYVPAALLLAPGPSRDLLDLVGQAVRRRR